MSSLKKGTMNHIMKTETVFTQMPIYLKLLHFFSDYSGAWSETELSKLQWTVQQCVAWSGLRE